MEYDIVGWIFGILHVFTIMWIIAGNVIHFVFCIKCFKVKKKCNNRNCHWRHFCEKYDDTRELFNFRIKLLKKRITEMQSAIDAVVGE